MKVTLVVSFQKSVQEIHIVSVFVGLVYGLFLCWFSLWSLSVLVRSVVSFCAGSVCGLCLCWFSLWSLSVLVRCTVSVLVRSMVFLCWPGLGDRVEGVGLEAPASLSLDELCFMDVLWLSPTSCGCPPQTAL